MSWLLFMDESGHDHRNMPYEVRGGVAIHANRLWSFIQAMNDAEKHFFGTELHEFKTEIKGSKLLNKKMYKAANLSPPLDDEKRQHCCRRFLTSGLEKKNKAKIDRIAYGQASIGMAKRIMKILEDHYAKLFASAIPRGVRKPDTYEAQAFLRKDHVFLLERFYYFLEEKDEYGILVMDEVEKTHDRKFVRTLQKYFIKTQIGQERAQRIAPAPLFVSSDMTYPVQAADLCIYAINWGFRLYNMGMDAEERQEIHNDFGYLLSQLQYIGTGRRGDESFRTFGIVYVGDPYDAR